MRKKNRSPTVVGCGVFDIFPRSGFLTETFHFFNCGICQLSEGKCRHGVVGCGCGLAGIAALANGLHNGNLTKQRHVHIFGQAFHTFFAEQVVFVLGQFSRGEPGHILDQAEDWHVDFFVLIHVDALTCVVLTMMAPVMLSS